MLNTQNTKCPHPSFESLTVTNERGRTVEYQCVSCKVWFSHKEKTRIVKDQDLDITIQLLKERILALETPIK